MWRYKTAFILYLAIFLLIVIRLFYWQVVAADNLAITAAKQYEKLTPIPAVRGMIKTIDGSVLVANETAYTLTVDKTELKSDFKKFADSISPFFVIEQPGPEATLSGLLRLPTKDEVVESILNKLNQGSDWVVLFKKIPNPVKDAIDQMHFQGLYFSEDQKRYYPESSMSASLLGFIGSDYNGYDQGYFGLEGFYDRELKGSAGLIQEEKDVLGRPILIGDKKVKNAQDGRTLILSVDRMIQYLVETKLREGLVKYGAKAGTVTVLNPKTGKVLAAVALPGYDPGTWYRFDPKLYKNPIVADSFEPGSIFKVLVMAAGIDTRVVEQDTRCTICQGPVTISGYSIKTWNNKYYPDSTMTEVLEHSDNTGMVFVSQKLKKDTMLSYLKRFGIGSLTGVDLEEETTPQLRPDDDWKTIDLATTSFGQGIAVSAMQMVRAVGAIANNGVLMQPQVVQQVVKPDGEIIDIKPKEIRRVISVRTAKVLTEMMINAVDKGEARYFKPKGYRIAGKTGTAQIPVAGHYDEKRTIASFVGFAPADDPKFVALVTLTEPTSSPWGSETAAPLFFSIAKELFSYLSIPPQ